MESSKRLRIVSTPHRKPVEPEPNVSADALEQCVFTFMRTHHVTQSRLLLGLSGGVDSMVLLEIMGRLRQQLGVSLEAMHVHHGISAHADEWARFCRNACDARALKLIVERVRVERAPSESLEEQARLKRYECFARAGADGILLAHHLDDQCETFFLRLLRGSGLRGLSGMPMERTLHHSSSARILRPLLAISRRQILDYAKAHSLSYVEDDSNTNRDFARNFLRLDVLPLIESKFPAYRITVERALRNLRDADTLMVERARTDLQDARSGESLRIDVLRAMGEVRALAVLRAFLEEKNSRPPARARLEELLRQTFNASSDAQVSWRIDGGEFRRYRNRLFWLNASDAEVSLDPLTWNHEHRLRLPGKLGELRFSHRQGEGLSRAKLSEGACEVRFRHGRERLQLAPNRPSRSLKNLFQEAATPPWIRATAPLFFCGGQLAWVEGLGYACGMLASPHEPGVIIERASASVAQ